LYIGRLFAIVYLAPVGDPHAVHHDAASERPMNWSLVPLMVGAIVFGYLGPWLQGRLFPALGDAEPLPGPISVIGLVAFALGAIGFGAACWYFSRPVPAVPDEGEPSYQPDAWVRAIGSAGYAAALGLSRIQSGVLPRYALGSLVGLAIILLVRVVAR
jgi:hypothetical protein